MATKDMVVSHDDVVLLSALVDHAVRRAGPSIAEVEGRARRAIAASLNTTVEYQDLGSGQRARAALVHPAAADAGRGLISVLSPVGRALLGHRIGHEVEVTLPNGDSRLLAIVSITEGVHQ